jgi:hypothetical protein
MSTSSQSFEVEIPQAAVAMQPHASVVPAEVYAEVARLGIGEQLPAVIGLTREVFGDFAIDISDDAEIPNCSYVTFRVRSDEPLEEAFAKESEWIRRLPRCPTQAPGSFCISVDISDGSH